MPNLISFPDGGYDFIKGGFPYSQGVRALEGFAIERVRFARPLPVTQGFAAIEAHLASIGRSRTTLCAAELRSPKPFTMSGFAGFNEGYVAVLKQWGLFRDGPCRALERCTGDRPTRGALLLRVLLHRA